MQFVSSHLCVNSIISVRKRNRSSDSSWDKKKEENFFFSSQEIITNLFQETTIDMSLQLILTPYVFLLSNVESNYLSEHRRRWEKRKQKLIADVSLIVY